MNKCGKCGSDIQVNVKYCKKCGGSTSFDDKKARVMNQEKNWVKPGLIVAVVVVVLVGGWMFKESGAGNRMAGTTSFTPNRDSGRLSKAQPVTTEAGEVRIPLKNVNDGNAHFFSHSADGRTITFFLMKASDGRISTAFDACMACNHAKLGYRQEGNKVVCNNCGMAFSPSDIGKRTGGCNPIPIEKSGDGEIIVLKAKDIEAGAHYF